MINGILTLDDFDFKGKTVIVRLDLNTPIDPVSGEFLEDRRMRSHIPTLQELSDDGARIVCLAHQGRAGEPQFTSLERHAQHLSDLLGKKVEFIESVFGLTAQNAIKNMDDGEIILLNNVRIYSEEAMERPADVQANSFLVKGLAPLCDIFINDAFGTSHRSHASTVGFTQVLPSAAGRLMEGEIRALGDVVKNPKAPLIFVLGGAKVKDSIRIIEELIDGPVEKILTGGVLANVFLSAMDYRLGDPSIEFIRGKKLIDQIPAAKELIQNYPEKIILPKDVALDNNGSRMELPLSSLPQDYRILDVGSETVKNYVDIIRRAGTVFFNGALGYYELPSFAKGTEEIIKAIADSDCFSVIGGGDTVAAARNLGIESKINHVSTGGKASIDFLAGTKMPAIEALRNSPKSGI